MSDNNEKPNNINKLACVLPAAPRLWRREPPEGHLGDDATAIVIAPELDERIGDVSRRLALAKASSLGPYALYLATRRSARAQQTMREGLARAAKLLPGGPYDAADVPWHELGAEHTGIIYAELGRRNYSPWTAKITLAAVRGVLHEAWKLKLIDREAFARATTWARIDTDPLRGAAGREITQEELEKLAAYCRKMGPDGQDWPASAYGAMLEALFALLVGAGMRANEVGHVPMAGSVAGKPLGFLSNEGKVRYLAKGNKERLVSLKPAEIDAVEAWLSVRAELDVKEPTLLVRVLPDGRIGEPAIMTRRVIGYICTLVSAGAGVAHFSPHDCRRTFGTRGWRQTGDGALIQRLMGHASIGTTAIYDKRGAEEDAKARLERMDMWPGRKKS